MSGGKGSSRSSFFQVRLFSLVLLSLLLPIRSVQVPFRMRRVKRTIFNQSGPLKTLKLVPRNVVGWIPRKYCVPQGYDFTGCSFDTIAFYCEKFS